MKTKSAKECEDHYFSFYYKSREDMLPQKEDLIIKSGQRIFQIAEGEGKVDIDEEMNEEALKKVEAY